MNHDDIQTVLRFLDERRGEAPPDVALAADRLRSALPDEMLCSVRSVFLINGQQVECCQPANTRHRHRADIEGQTVEF